jgi:hypothetical protein
MPTIWPCMLMVKSGSVRGRLFWLWLFWSTYGNKWSSRPCHQDRTHTCTIREIPIRIYLPLRPDKVTRDLHCWEWQQPYISALLGLSLTHGHKSMLLDTQVCLKLLYRH